LAELWSRQYLDNRGAALGERPPAAARAGAETAVRPSNPLVARTGIAHG